MDFIDQIRELSNTVSKWLELVKTEEGTKNYLIMPFIKIFGYDIHNPTEVVPEYTCDAPGKNGEKVDYAIMKDGEPFMLVECKFAHDELQAKHTAQLLKYFNSIPELKVGVLTNGVIYKFYTDLENENIMDATPFLEINMLDLDNNLVEELRYYIKESPPHPIDLRERAKELKYTREVKRIFENELEAPSDDFVEFFAKRKHVYAGKTKITKSVKDDFRNYIKKALKEVINKKITDALKSTIEKTDGKEPEPQPPFPDPSPSGVVTTKEEKEGFEIVRGIFQGTTDYERISYKDWKGFFNVILGGYKDHWELVYGKRHQVFRNIDSMQLSTTHPYISNGFTANIALLAQGNIRTHQSQNIDNTGPGWIDTHVLQDDLAVPANRRRHHEKCGRRNICGHFYIACAQPLPSLYTNFRAIADNIATESAQHAFAVIPGRRRFPHYGFTLRI